MRIEETVTLPVARPLLWKLVSDPERYPAFMSGITRCQREGRGRPRAGARYRLRVRVGAVQLGGTIELVEFAPGSEVAWVGVRGIDQRGRWRLKDVDGGTEVTIRLSYTVPGGMLGVAAELASGPMLRSSVRQSLKALQLQSH